MHLELTRWMCFLNIRKKLVYQILPVLLIAVTKACILSAANFRYLYSRVREKNAAFTYTRLSPVRCCPRATHFELILYLGSILGKHDVIHVTGTSGSTQLIATPPRAVLHRNFDEVWTFCGFWDIRMERQTDTLVTILYSSSWAGVTTKSFNF